MDTKTNNDALQASAKRYSAAWLEYKTLLDISTKTKSRKASLERCARAIDRSRTRLVSSALQLADD